MFSLQIRKMKEMTFQFQRFALFFIMLMIVLGQAETFAQSKGLPSPKEQQPLQLFAHKRTLASPPTILLQTAKGEQSTLWTVTANGFKKKVKVIKQVLAIDADKAWVQESAALNAYSLSSGELLEKRKPHFHHLFKKVMSTLLITLKTFITFFTFRSCKK